MGKLSALRIVAGKDHSEQKALDEARERARPILRSWLKKVEKAVIEKQCQPIDYLLAKELTNYPSANEGRCYAGQTRLGTAVGRCARTARESLKRLGNNGLLLSKRGGPGQTASWFFCFEFTPIFPEQRAAVGELVSVQDRKTIAGLDRKTTADKPSELKPLEHKPSPLIPTGSSGCTTVRLPMKEGRESPVIDGQDSVREISFQEFWEAIGRRGAEGFARAEWRKLTTADRTAVADWLRGQGKSTRLWAGTWIRDRVWEEPIADTATKQAIEHTLGDGGDRLRARLGDDVFASWFGKAKIEEATDKVIALSVPTVFLKNWISAHYGDAVLECWRDSNQLIERVEITVRS